MHLVGTRLNPRRNPRILKDATYGTYTFVGHPVTYIVFIILNKSPGGAVMVRLGVPAGLGETLSRILEGRLKLPTQPPLTHPTHLPNES